MMFVAMLDNADLPVHILHVLLFVVQIVDVMMGILQQLMFVLVKENAMLFAGIQPLAGMKLAMMMKPNVIARRIVEAVQGLLQEHVLNGVVIGIPVEY